MERSPLKILRRLAASFVASKLLLLKFLTHFKQIWQLGKGPNATYILLRTTSLSFSCYTNSRIQNDRAHWGLKLVLLTDGILIGSPSTGRQEVLSATHVVRELPAYPLRALQWKTFNVVSRKEQTRARDKCQSAMCQVCNNLHTVYVVREKMSSCTLWNNIPRPQCPAKEQWGESKHDLKMREKS